MLKNNTGIKLLYHSLTFGSLFFLCQKLDAEDSSQSNFKAFPFCKVTPLPEINLRLGNSALSLNASGLINCRNFTSLSIPLATKFETTYHGDTDIGRGLLGLNRFEQEIKTGLPGIAISEASFNHTSHTQIMGKQYDFIVNRDVLSKCTLKLNPTDKILTIVMKDDDIAENTEISAPIEVAAEVGGHHFKFSLDLSLGYSFALSEKTAKTIGNNDPNAIRKVTTASWFNKYEIHELSRVTIDSCEMPPLLGTVGGAENIIGMSALCRFITTIGMTSGNVQLEARDVNIYYDHSFLDGMWPEIVMQNSVAKVYVRDLLPNSIAERSGFMQGDQIVEIGGISFINFEMVQFTSAMQIISTVRKSGIRCKILRDGVELELNLQGNEA